MEDKGEKNDRLKAVTRRLVGELGENLLASIEKRKGSFCQQWKIPCVHLMKKIIILFL